MTELLKPFTSARAFVNAVSSWGGPLAAALAVYVLFVFPAIDRTALVRAGARALHHDGIRPWWALIGVWLVLTFVLSAASRWIYQLLEGLLWPKNIREHRTRIHTLHWEVLSAQEGVEQAESRLDFANEQLATSQDTLASASTGEEQAAAKSKVAASVAERDLAQEQLEDARKALSSATAARQSRPRAFLRRRRPPLFMLKSIRAYPARPEWIRATRLGNRIREFETVGVARYQLDVLAHWYELLVTAPSSLAANIQAARQGVEMWVGTWSAAMLLALASVATEIVAATERGAHGLITPLVVAALACAGAAAAYRAATTATDEWGIAVNALVNLGRGPLARAYGLNIPATVADEKLMWEALYGYEFFRTDSYADRLDEYRAAPASPGDAAGEAAGPAAVCDPAD